MDGAGKIALGIVAAALLLLVGFIGYREFERQRDIAEVTQMVQQFGEDAQRALEDGKRQREAAARRRAQAQARAQAADLDRRRLASNQRCVGGTVVQISGTTYTQVLGGDLRPVACRGRYRLR